MEDSSRAARAVNNKVRTPGKPEGEDWARVFYVLGRDCGMKWEDFQTCPVYYLGILWEQAQYDEELRFYHQLMLNPLS